MPIRRSLAVRLTQERAILTKFFPSFAWSVDGTQVRVEGTVRTNSGKDYRLRVALPADYPSSVPRMYVVRPKPLRGIDGMDLAKLGSCAWMHILTPKEGAVSICHYHPDMWGPQQTIYKVVLKGRLWVEAFEGHLRTGLPIDAFLSHQE